MNFLHRLRHVLGSYSGHPVTFTFSALPNSPWFTGFRCGTCGDISMIKRSEITPQLAKTVARLMEMDNE